MRLILFIVLSLNYSKCDRATYFQGRNLHEAEDLTDADIRALANLSDNDDINETLDNILIPRVVGTPNHKKVNSYIKNRMKNLGWSVTEDVFNDRTPTHGTLEFRNIIARLNPNAERFLVLACHYDSKYTREGDFIGATDSAVPCAMMINLAKVMKPLLDKTTAVDDISLMLIFFDGEEAFKEWGPKDSIYGARHLASEWQKSTYKLKSGDTVTENEKIDIFVLLDLLGAPDPSFYNFFSNTAKWYNVLIQTEQRLSNQRLLERYSYGIPQQIYFQAVSTQSFVEDDHAPFLKKNVPILHLIPLPFPSVWHTSRDNRNAIDMSTVDNLNKIIRIFVAEYLHIKP